jgi:uncharacterized protein (DUF433 family)
MADQRVNQHVDLRNGGYYVAGSRIGLDILVRDFQLGKSPEQILQSYPSLGSLARVYGAITFILENPDGIALYLKDQDQLWDDLKQRHPLPPDMLERFLRARELIRKAD